MSDTICYVMNEVFLLRYRQRLRRVNPMRFQKTEKQSFFSEKEIIIRHGAQTRVFKISVKMQWLLFLILLIVGMWTAYSYQMYSVSDRIISYQEKQLGETRSAYVDLMSDFVAVHNNISSMVDTLSNDSEPVAGDVEDYLKKAEVIEEKIRQITSREDWIDTEDLDSKSALRDAVLHRDMALEEKKLLEEKVKQLEAAIAALTAFEMDVLDKVENISSKEMDKVKNSISIVNNELKKRGKYYNPLANSKKDSKGGIYVPDKLSAIAAPELVYKAQRTYDVLADSSYYSEILKKIPLGKPVWTYWLTSPFGKRSDPINAKSSVHKGVDLASNKGNMVKTMAEGKVIKAGVMNGYGKVIEIDHGNGFKTKYAHLNAMYVNLGDKVSQGQAIGEVGSTGRSTGPHLHYEVLYEGVNIDPMVFIKAR